MAATLTKPRPWLMSELKEASQLWKSGMSQVDIAQKLGRNVESLKKKVGERRDLFPRRVQYHGDLENAVTMKFQVTEFVYKLIKQEAKDRGISINMLVRETLRDRFVRKLWKPQPNTSTEKVKYFNGSRE